MGTLSDLLSLAHERAENLGLPYQGALTPAETWQVMQLAPGAKLVDVRTRAELDWVGRVPGAVGLWWLLLPMLALGLWLYVRDGRVARAWWRR